MPADVTVTDGAFCVKGVAVTVDPALDELSQKAVQRFVQALETATGVKTKSGEGGISFVLNASLAPEQYTINVKADGAVVEASALNGFVYACETLKQMLPAAIYGSVKAKADWVLPYCSIQDQPRFAYRGMHMDPCRHFWTIEETKRYLDVMTAYKLNRFHWHLTEDQGWRMEIKAYPKLTEVGAWRNGTVIKKDWGSNDGIRYGGFYTQEEMKEIVAYAAERGITVIPEVDLPGHMVAALAAYPQLGCTGGPYEVWTRWGVAKDILCAGNDEIFTFLEKVFDELMDIFPSEYIHIGGDECFNGDAEPDRPDPWDVCPKCAARMKALGIKKGPQAKHYLQNYVTDRVQNYLNAHGRKIIGWDEVLEGNLSEGATVMSWRGVEGGIKAAEKGFDAIMTPGGFCYFDYYQSQERDKEPFGIGGHLPLERVYNYEPFDGLKPGTEKHILGVQANLWTEYIATPEHLEYMLLPRMCALSEVQWCAASAKDYERFNASLDHTFQMLDAMGVNYSLDCRGLVGLDRQPARTPEEMEAYLAKKDWGW
ncbi:MAG: beta-N-acetylhexosaminidase [Bacteroidales bacterium]|nr:beta-N-acetylhexosaminidase [Bacteroidales bacterium]MBQ9701603.1 beta-N-acetylhexosaminidase [Bacteroidales bacterium]MBR1782844.1 beta-N-acetylhexosaminidase [Bacteroidales bacterium]MBR1783797.1 beta-N-acetylhexosaminidase [Bacteroidales bacterium]